MLLVKTSIAPSTIPGAGTGLFAGEFIPAGTLIWKFSNKVDRAYTREEVEQLPEPTRSEILSLYHPYISKQTGRYITFGDNAGYLNHSSNPNIVTRYEQGVEEDLNFALRDIVQGEELTIDYSAFSADFQESSFSLTSL